MIVNLDISYRYISSISFVNFSCISDLVSIYINYYLISSFVTDLNLIQLYLLTNKVMLNINIL